MRRLALALVLGCSANRPAPPPPPPPVRPSLPAFAKVVLSPTMALALTKDGFVYQWRGRDVPTKVDGLEKVTAIGVGDSHACALADGVVSCWEKNDRGQLGSSGGDHVQPTRIAEEASFDFLAAGGNQTCARKKADKVVFCWGAADPDHIVKTPMPVFGLPGAEALSVGGSHACALTLDETQNVRCWGDNHMRQLGVLKRDEKGLPTTPNVLATSLALGVQHGCAIAKEGGVKCWGGSLACIPGEPKEGRIMAVFPSPMPGMEGATLLAAGGDQVCAKIPSGVVCARANPDRTCKAVPVAGLPADVVDLAVTNGHGYALDAAGVLHDF